MRKIILSKEDFLAYDVINNGYKIVYRPTNKYVVEYGQNCASKAWASMCDLLAGYYNKKVVIRGI